MAKKEGNLHIVLPVVVVAVLAVFAIIASRGPSVSVDDALAIEDGAHVKGDDASEVTLIEFGDFQCPGCAGYSPLISQLYEEFNDDLRVVFRHFPLVSIHPNAIPAAQPAEAAAMQGKFWEMHDELFARQSEWSSSTDPLTSFMRYAQSLELDMEQFEANYGSSEIADKIRRDLRAAQALGLDSTPSFFVDGEKIETPRDYVSFKAKIEEALAAKGKEFAVPSVPELKVKDAQ